MKHLYTFVLLASLATIGVVTAKPKIIDNIATGLKERMVARNAIDNSRHPDAPTWNPAVVSSTVVDAPPTTFGGQFGSSTPPAFLTGGAVATDVITPTASVPAPALVAPTPAPNLFAELPQTPTPSPQPTLATHELEQTIYTSMVAVAPIAEVPQNTSHWGETDSLPPLPTEESFTAPIATPPVTPAMTAPPQVASPYSTAPPLVAASIAPRDTVTTATNSATSALSPPIFSEMINVDGADTVARIGTHVVLLCDILPQAKRDAITLLNEKMAELGDEQRQQVTDEERDRFVKQLTMMKYPVLLQEQMQIALLYNDFVASRRREEVEMQEKRVSGVFDQEELPSLMKTLGVDNLADLKVKLKNEYGSSLERERLLYSRRMIAFGWLNASVGDVDNKCTHDEMLEYYTQNQSEFEHKARVRWQEFFAKKSGADPTERDAWNRIAWIGNSVAGGAPAEQIAQEYSQGTKAANGGVWDWMTQGNLASQTLEDYLFTAQVGQLSPIIETPQGFYIVRVLERDETHYTPFVEAQVTIRDKIKAERRGLRHEEYFTQLQKRYPMEVVKSSIDLLSPPSPLTAPSSYAAEPRVTK